MLPDDPRHGTEAGYSAHNRAGQKPCQSCQTAKHRHDKRRRVFGPALMPVPADVRQVLDLYSIRTLAKRTGVSECAIANARRRGDAARMKPDTIAKLRRLRVPTDIGVVRRVQALARLGWSGPEIAARTTGVPYTTIVRLRDRDERNYLGRDDLREQIAAAYDAMCMTVPPLTRHSSRIARRAERNGWPPPLAWDDIDNPAETPSAATGRVNYDRAELLGEWDHLRRSGDSIQQAADRLGVTAKAIEKAIERDRKDDAA